MGGLFGTVDEVARDNVANHIADPVAAHDASAIANTPAGGIAATTVQAALNELDAEKAALTGATFTGQLSGKGTGTDDAAAAGYIGEIIASEVLTASSVALTSSAPKTITSIVLTPGDWDITGFVGINTAGGAVLTARQGGFSTTADTIDARLSFRQQDGGLTANAIFRQGVPGTYVRVANGTTTTLYLTATATFASGTASAFGAIIARRAR